jgi:hypothetical protein
MITLTEKWNSGHCTFPIGTVFIPQREVRGRTVYAYGVPGGSYGEVILDKGQTPGL